MAQPIRSRVIGYAIVLLMCLYPNVLPNQTSPPALSAPQEGFSFELLKERAIATLIEGAQDSSSYYYQTARQLATQQKDMVSLLGLIKAYGKAYRDKLGDPDNAITIFRQGTEKATGLQAQTKEEWEAQASMYVNLAYMLNTQGAFTEAVAPYESALRIFDQELREVSSYTALYVYRYLGNTYTRLGEYTAAEALLLRAYQVFFEQEENNDLAAESCSDLGILYRAWQKPEKAIEQYQQGVLLSIDGSISKALLHANLAKLYWEKENTEKVKNESQSAIDILQQYDPENSYYDIHQYTATSFELLARVASLNQDKTATLTYLDSARYRLVSEYGNENRREMGKFYCRAAESYQRLDMLEEAHESYQQAFKAVLINFQPTSLDDLPESTSFYAENTIMEVLVSLTELYKVKYEKSKQEQHLTLALQCHKLIYDVDQALRRSYLYDSSKLFNLEESRERSEQGIALAQQLYELTGDENYLYQAFVFAERNRSSLLREAYRTSEASALAGVSEEDLASEEELKYQVSEAEEELFRLRGAEDVVDSLIQQAEQQLFQTRTALEDWIGALEAANPRYYQLKYADDVPELADLQDILDKQQLLVEYFIGNDHLYIFTLDQKGLQLQQLALPEDLEGRVVAWRRNIQDYQQNGVDKKKLMQDYQLAAQSLYQDLLNPVLTTENNYQDLLIIPSGILDLLPFEALLSRPVMEEEKLSEYPYLLKDYVISYSYSASLQWSLSQLPRQGSGRGGFAPMFTGTNGWAPIACSGDILEEILNEPDTDQLMLDTDATIDQFKTVAQRYRLLHLATHAQANPEQGDFSFIVFSDGQGGYDSLFAKDLYPLSIEAELVILSACETALGTIYNSEGVISLARGFHYAGARSVLTTLWSINDGANCALMPEFYRQLDEGKSKKQALQAAKLAFLEKVDERTAHPVYWAGFQLLGNPRPIDEASNWTYWLLGGLVLVLLLYFIWHSRQNEN